MGNFNEKIKEYLKEERVGVLAVEMPGGWPHAATVHFSYDQEVNCLYFETYSESMKAEAIVTGREVKASFVVGASEAKMKTLQIDGVVKMLQGEVLGKFEENYFARFPNKLEKYKKGGYVCFAMSPLWWRFTDWTHKEGKKIVVGGEVAKTLKKTRIVFVHGNGARSWKFAWSPWLKTELEKQGYETFFETMPDSIVARGKYWIPFLKEFAKVGQNDCIVGWSSGAVCAMRYAEENKIKGSILVSPSYTDMGDELEKESGYFEKAWDWDKIKQNQEKIALVYSEDDPFIPKDEFEHIAESLKPEVIKFSDKKHFIVTEKLQEVVDYIVKNFD